MKTPKPLLTLRMVFSAGGIADRAAAGRMDRPRKPERRCICRIYLSAYWGLPAGMAAAVSGVAAAGLGIPLPAAVHAGYGGAGLCALCGELLYPAAARRALSAVGSGTGVGSCRRGVRCGPQDPDQHGRHHHRGAGTDSGQLLPVPRPSQTALAAPAGGLCRHGCSPSACWCSACTYSLSSPGPSALCRTHGCRIVTTATMA